MLSVADLIRGDQVDVVRDGNVAPGVVVERICGKVGVAFGARLQKLKVCFRATVGVMPVVAQFIRDRDSRLSSWPSRPCGRPRST